MSSFLGIVFCIRNIILLGFNHQKTLLRYDYHCYMRYLAMAEAGITCNSRPLGLKVSGLGFRA